MDFKAVSNSARWFTGNALPPKYCYIRNDRLAFIPAPAASLQLLYGESATLILDGQKVLSVKSQRNGFKFQYPEITGALSQIINS